jgi:hypothetical protein
VFNVMPWRALDKYPSYRGISPAIRQLACESRFGRALVFVRGPEWPDYHSAFALNPPRLDLPKANTFEAPVFARDLGLDAAEKLRLHYPDWPTWVIAGSTESGGRAGVIIGPVPPGQPMPAWAFAAEAETGKAPHDQERE